MSPSFEPDIHIPLKSGYKLTLNGEQLMEHLYTSEYQAKYALKEFLKLPQYHYGEIRRIYLPDE
jgi:hypothetical protein